MIPYICEDFHPDRDVPDFCEGCKQLEAMHFALSADRLAHIATLYSSWSAL